MPLTVKKRKSPVDPLPVSPMKILAKDPNVDPSGRLVDAARARFFNTLAHGSTITKPVQFIEDKEEEVDEGSPESSKPELAQKTEPALLKRKRKGLSDKQSFIMKLFDRSVDLAPFDDATSLYPICRAWIQNTPSQLVTGKHKKKKAAIAEKADEDNDADYDIDEVLNTLNSSEEIELNKLPKPKPLLEPNDRIPSPISVEKSTLDDFINRDQDKESLPTRDSLLSEHREKWVAVRKSWHEAERKNEERYKDSRLILDAIYNKAQKHYQ